MSSTRMRLSNVAIWSGKNRICLRLTTRFSGCRPNSFGWNGSTSLQLDAGSNSVKLPEARRSRGEFGRCGRAGHLTCFSEDGHLGNLDVSPDRPYVRPRSTNFDRLYLDIDVHGYPSGACPTFDRLLRHACLRVDSRVERCVSVMWRSGAAVVCLGSCGVDMVHFTVRANLRRAAERSISVSAGAVRFAQVEQGASKTRSLAASRTRHGQHASRPSLCCFYNSIRCD